MELTVGYYDVEKNAIVAYDKPRQIASARPVNDNPTRQLMPAPYLSIRQLRMYFVIRPMRQPALACRTRVVLVQREVVESQSEFLCFHCRLYFR